VTGNTFNTGGHWGGGEAVIRLRAGPVFSGSPTDYWAPTNWLSLDNGDTDLGGDYLLYNPSTRQTAIWYLNNNIFLAGAYGPTLPTGWSLVDALPSVP
jgi:hypothetical protein